MADQQKKSQPEKPEFSGGWHKPQSPGGWHTPDVSPSQGSWRQPAPVALPAELEVEPEAEGAWHLPKPEDTVFSTEPESPAPAAPVREPGSNIKPEDMLPISEAAPAALEPLDDDDDAFSMSELVALASLVEQSALPDILPGSAAPGVAAATSESQAEPIISASGLSPAERAAIQAAGGRTEPVSDLPLISTAEGSAPQPLERLRTEEPDASTGQAGAVSGEQAAEYARLQAQRWAAGTAGDVTSQGQATSSGEPISYAQEQLAQIQKQQPAATPAPTTQQQELLQKYRKTEREVAKLRQMLQAGQITEEQLREQLNDLLVLDEKRVWWMMGVESDVWYRYDESQAQWIIDVPPVLAAASATGTAESGVIGAQPLPQFPSEPVQPQDYTQPSAVYQTPAQPDRFGQVIGDDSPLPRQVPVQDPDQTMVGANAPYMYEQRQSEAATQQAYGVEWQETVAHTPLEVAPADESLGSARQAYDAGAPDQTEATPYFDQVAEEERRQTIGLFVRLAAIGAGLLALLLAGGIGIILLNYSNIANEYQPSIAALANYQPAFQTVQIYDAQDRLIASINSTEGGARTNIELAEISPFMIHAVLSLENERFFEDPGWDIVAIGRAFIQNLGSGTIESGASTITQQIARQLVLGRYDVSAERKIQEVVIAAEISKQYPKADILELYLNEIYFGNQAYGVEAAAQFYFGHSAESLNLYESAFLTGLIQSPSVYDPVIHPDETREAYGVRRQQIIDRMDAVLARMEQVNCLQFPGTGISLPPEGFCITPEVARQQRTNRAEVLATEFTARTVNFQYPHFIQFVRDQVDRHYGEGTMFRQGFKIYTTLNSNIQDEAIRDLQAAMALYGSRDVNTGAIMVTNPADGAILAMVGGPDFNNEAIAGQLNNALTWQQPGSAIKPVVYAAALEGRDTNGDGVVDHYLTPASIIWDVPTTYTNTVPPYTPVNFDSAFRGPISVRYALQNSINVAAVKAYDFIGADRFQDIASRLGLQFLDGAQFGLPTAIGATEVTLYNMMTAYGTLAANGTRHDLYAVRRITTSEGVDAAWPGQPAAIPNAVSAQLAYLMQNILSDDTSRSAVFGQGGPMTIPGYPTSNFVAAKTGTSNDARDLWTMGFTKNAVVGVWLGRHDNQPTRVTAASTAAAPIWQRLMQYSLSVLPNPAVFTEVAGIQHYDICVDTGTQQTPNCTGLRNEIFIGNQPPPGPEGAFVRQVEIDSWTGLLATAQCQNNKITQTFVNIQDTAALAWLNGAGKAIAQRYGITDQALPMPTAACDTNTEIPIALFNYPSEGTTVQGIVNITGSASATTTFSRYQIDAVSSVTGQAIPIAGPITTPVASGTLGTWDTRTLPNGTYFLRLQMFANNAYAGYLTRQITVNINNPTPTAEPVLPTTAPLPTIEPLPFDTPAAQPTLNIGG